MRSPLLPNTLRGRLLVVNNNFTNIFLHNSYT
nr:MAG TPA: hypothetical protein [Caudoviricetes sp.]